jgi:beta-galactosidase
MIHFGMNAYPPQQIDPRSSQSSTNYGRFSLLVYDPNKSVTGWLDKYGVPYQTIDSLEALSRAEPPRLSAAQKAPPPREGNFGGVAAQHLEGNYGFAAQNFPPQEENDERVAQQPPHNSPPVEGGNFAQQNSGVVSRTAQNTNTKRTILLIGRDAITPANCDSTALQAFAAQGNGVIVLEQKYPLRYSALPCEMEPARNEGRIGFMENESHPIFRSLKQKDFFTWTDGHILYRDSYKKPMCGAKSLLQCDHRLENSAVVEVPVGQGVMILSQLLIGEKIEKSVVAKQLLGNMIQYAAEYKLQYTPVIVWTEGLDKNFLKELDAMQLKYTTAEKPAVGNQKSTLIIAAAPKNIDAMLKTPDLNAFYQKGGTILLHGLTPDGLVDFNKLVGVDHMIREFRRERVGLPMRRSPLTQGLSLSDIAMSSGERIFGWASDEYVASDTYSYAVDIDDAAPFAAYQNDFVRMMSNGMVSADGWPYIVNVPAPDQPPLDFALKFPKSIELCEVTWTGNTFYYPVTKFGVFFEGQSQGGQVFNVEPNTEPQTFAIDPPIAGKDLTLRLAEWTVLPDKGKVTGLDNIALKIKRPDDFDKRVKPLLNIGTMVHYPKRDGAANDLSGIVLCNLKFPDSETVPGNAVKKRNILAAVLRNLGAEFVESQTVIAGTPMQYVPVNISEKCNGFRSNRGWLDNGFTFEAMPSGLQKFAGVLFNIYAFPTSPVPDCIIIRDQNVEGIAVAQKADTLFFLHTMKLDARRNREEIRDGKRFETLKYVVRYEDGKTEEVPIYAELDIEHFRQKEVSAIPGAMLGWVRRDEASGDYAAAYVKRWNNPYPSKAIVSIDVVRGKDFRGASAVLGITAARKER